MGALRSFLNAGPAARAATAVLLGTLAAAGCKAPEDDPVDAVEESDTPVVEDNCGNVPPEGRCVDNELVQCVDGEKVRTDCELFSCGEDDDGVFDCIEPELGGNPDVGDAGELADFLSGTARSNRDGIAAFTFDVDGHSSFLVSVSLPQGEGLVWLDALYDPQGRVIAFDDPVLNMAIYADNQSTLAWPSRAEDGRLAQGTWTAAFQVVDDRGFLYNNAEVAVDIILKDDDDADEGVVRVALIYTGMDTVDPDLSLGVDLSLDAWRSLYARYGLELVVDQYTAGAFPLAMPQPAQDGDVWWQLSAATGPADILLVLCEDFANADEGLLGVAGQIPGSPGAGPRGGVLVSWARHAGVNGRFNSDEVSFLASTMAHEVGHFTGLFHPVEFDWEHFDPLDDTPECGSERQCYDRLGDNLMFPASTCYGAGCEDDLEISDDQAAVLHLYPGTL